MVHVNRRVKILPHALAVEDMATLGLYRILRNIVTQPTNGSLANFSLGHELALIVLATDH